MKMTLSQQSTSESVSRLAIVGVAVFVLSTLGCVEGGLPEQPASDAADASTDTSRPPDRCTPGAMLGCTCPSGRESTQRCRNDGSGWTSCRCRDVGVDTAGEPSDTSDTSTDPDGTSDATVCTSSQEQCDGRDNDCDGATDENLDQPCANQKGICTGSTAACLNGSYASCGAQQYSSDYEKTETSCDGKDNDCDGTVDENCSCTDGATQKCGSNTGICSKGSQTCTKGSWGTCTGETEPNSSETCDGKDDDCDGSTDEHLTTTCSNQNGVCAGSTISCQNGQFPSCGASEFGSDYESNESTCDNLDNDCDGSVDESLTKPCSNQTGICQGSTRSCSGGSYPSCGPSDYGGQYEDPETSCDGFDNDCDGTVDESQTLRTFDFEGSDPAGWSKIPSGASNLNVDSDATSGGAAQGSEYAKAWYKHGTCKPVAGIGASFSVSGTIDQITLDARVDVPNWGHASIFLRDSNGNTTTLWTAMGKGNGYQTQGWKTLTFDHTTNSNTTTSNGAEIRRNAIPSGVGNGTVTLIFGNDDDSGYCTYGDHTWTTRVDDVKVKSTCP